MIKESLQIIRNIILKKVPAETKVFLFGSRAEGKEQSDSDIDIGFLGKKKLDRELLSQMRQEIEESIVPYKVDLVDFFGKDENFKKLALEKTILWKN